MKIKVLILTQLSVAFTTAPPLEVLVIGCPGFRTVTRTGKRRSQVASAKCTRTKSLLPAVVAVAFFTGVIWCCDVRADCYI